MKAKDLIKKLKQLDGDTEVYTEQYSSYDINSVLVARNKSCSSHSCKYHKLFHFVGFIIGLIYII